MIQQHATILWNRQVGPQLYRLGLACDRGYEAVQPGQFIMLQVDQGRGPLLRRPFSVFGLIGASQQPEGIEVLYKVVGRGTDILSGMPPDHRLDILGPLGRGFDLTQSPPGRGPYYLAAGGIGVAPIRFLAHHLVRAGYEAKHCYLFLGGRNRSELLCRDDFIDLGMVVTITTDDGSAGDQCLITDPLQSAIETRPPAMLFACGPQGMLTCIAGIAEKNHTPCQVSMETMMACGMGACLGCAIQSRDPVKPYWHACKDGPVFPVEQLKW
jgi:dihydroorotate dehydrogenase electron transfer subunit